MTKYKVTRSVVNNRSYYLKSHLQSYTPVKYGKHCFASTIKLALQVAAYAAALLACLLAAIALYS